MALPLLTALAFREWAAAVDFLVGLGAALLAGCSLAWLGVGEGRPSWIHGMVTAGISWLAAMAVAAVPYWLSGHYLSYLDCMFDVMSGLTTTGLTLIQDLDHVSVSLNTWRHLLTFVGGQGIIVLALAFLSSAAGGGYPLYVGEAKDEKLFPSVLHTAKTIWKISLVYLVVGNCGASGWPEWRSGFRPCGPCCTACGSTWRPGAPAASRPCPRTSSITIAWATRS